MRYGMADGDGGTGGTTAWARRAHLELVDHSRFGASPALPGRWSPTELAIAGVEGVHQCRPVLPVELPQPRESPLRGSQGHQVRGDDTPP